MDAGNWWRFDVCKWEPHISEAEKKREGKKENDFTQFNEEEAWKQHKLTHQDSVLRLVSFDLQFDSLPQRQLHLPPQRIPHALYTERREERIKWGEI